jgi:hypothetical protein
VAAHFEIDDVIDPAHTRDRIVHALRSAPPPTARQGKRPFRHLVKWMSAASSTTIAPGSVTPSVNGEVIVAFAVASNASTGYTVTASMTISDQLPLDSGQYYGGCMAYLVQTTAGAVNPTFTASGSGLLVSNMATFEPSPAPTATGIAFFLL